MTSKLLLTVLCIVVASALAWPQTRIVGGETAASGVFPAVVSVRIDHSHECGGTIISNRHILTAGHCLQDSSNKLINANRITFRYGSTNIFAGGDIGLVQSVKVHENYGNYVNNLGILTLTSPLVFNDKVNKLDLPLKDQALADGAEVKIVGWGRTNFTSPLSFKLQESVAKKISSSQCEEEIGFGYPEVLCLGHDVGKGICQGDAGGPAADENTVYGLGSFMIGTCATKYPDGFTNLVHHLDWIAANTK